MRMITNNLKFTVFLCILIPFSSQLADSDEDSEGLGIPNDAVGRPKLPLRLNPTQNRRADIPSNRCYCTYNDGICDVNKTCIKDEMAACFHAVEEVYNKAEKRMETWHKYGCAPLEKGSNASHLTCNSWRSAHFHPKSIACCYEGDYCNMHIEPPPYVNANELEDDWSEESPLRQNLTFYVVMIFVVFVLVVGLVTLFFYQKRRRTTLKKCQSMSDVEKEPMLYEDSGSGSGSGKTTMNQRTVAQSLTIIKVIGRGRYGEVRKALYRGSYVAVKTFYTTDEESWKNERDVYQTHMLNHENILQYVAADICSEDSITQMLLITDYHQLGSLCDYLRREETLTIEEALQLCHSSVCGLEHLHAAVHGTGSRRKPEMAHRDIKSKNIIVKRPGVCCIADFGLAVRYEGCLLPEKVNVQVGTKRYMAPEVLSKTLNPASFSQFKMADMYSFALVMWEVARRVEWQPLAEAESEPVIPESSNSDSSGYCGSSEETSGRIMHRQSTSCEMSTRAMPYTPPFEGLVEGDPSFDEMKKIVCEKGNRPPIAHSWSNGSNLSLFVLSCVMRDCWHPAPQCRHSALKVKMELAKAIERLRETHNKTRSQKLSTSSNTGSLTKTNTIDSGCRDVIIRSDEENNISSNF